MSTSGRYDELIFQMFYTLSSDTDFEYEQIKSKLDEFETVNSEVEDFEDEGYLVD